MTTTDGAAVLAMVDGRDPSGIANWDIVNKSAPSRESTGKPKLDHMVEVLPISNTDKEHGFCILARKLSPDYYSKNPYEYIQMGRISPPTLYKGPTLHYSVP